MTPTTYHPMQPGIPIALGRTVQYDEVLPRSLDTSLVYRFWALQTRQPLAQPFEYLVLPDGCIDIVFDLDNISTNKGALIMTPHTTSIRLPLGTSFRYAGIRLYPGAWHLSPVEIVGNMKTVQHLADVNLVDTQEHLASSTRTDQLWPVLERCALTLQNADVIQKNPTITALLSTDAASAATIALRTGYSVRHIQRVLRRSVGFTPHDFIKVIRFQRALYTLDTSAYTDQPHYIRAFKHITGMTPQVFHQTYSNVA